MTNKLNKTQWGLFDADILSTIVEMDSIRI